MYYLGYDGGGTKSAFLLVNEKMETVAETELKVVDYPEEDPFPSMLSDGIKEITGRAGITPGDIAFACFAITAYGELPEISRAMEDAVRETLGHDRFLCCHDGVGAWAGSLELTPGINLIAGTGTVAYGRDDAGNEARAGGWGFFCGDEGSAYWLGRRLLSLYTKEADGRLPKGAVYKRVRESFAIESDFAFRHGLCEEIWKDRTQVAGLQKILLQAALDGDEAAADAYRAAAGELAEIVICALKKLVFTRGTAVPVSYSGGVFHAGSLILTPLAEALDEYGVRLVKPLHSPVYGAALMAVSSSASAR